MPMQLFTGYNLDLKKHLLYLFCEQIERYIVILKQTVLYINL